MGWAYQAKLDTSQLSTSATAGAADLRALKGALGDASEALERFQKLTGATTYQGAGGGLAQAQGPALSGPPAFSTATHEDFKRSRWETPPPNSGQGEKEKKTPKSSVPDNKKATKGANDLKTALGGVEKAGGLARMAVVALGAAAGIAGAGGLLKLAMGYRGMAQFQALTYRMGLDIRGLFKHVDPGPALRAFTKFEENFKRTSVTGHALEGILTRGFNGLFGFLEKAQPYITAFGQGMLLAGLYVENGILRARLALYPYTSALEDAVGKEDLIEDAAIAGGVAVVGLGIAAAVAAAPFFALGAAIAAVVAAIKQAIDLYRQWDSISIGKKLKADAWDMARSQVGLGPDQGGRDTDAQDKGLRAYQEAQARIAAEGQKSGKALGAGMVQGMDAAAADVKAAGGRLAGAADTGVREKAQIHSPSKLFEERARQMGAGAERGLDESAAGVQDAADQALVPDMSGGGGGGRGGAGGRGISIGQIGPFNIDAKGGKPEELRAALEAAAPWLADEIMRRIAEQLAVPEAP